MKGGLMNGLLSYMIFALMALAGMYIAYRPQLNSYTQTLNLSYKILPMPYIYSLYMIGSVLAFFVYENSDFIENLTYTRVFMPLIFAPLIYGSFLFLSELTSILITILCITITVLIQPIGEGISYPELPIWSIRLLVILFASIYCLGSSITNFLPHTFLIPKITALVGLSIMASLGAVPVYIALCSAILIGALGGYFSLNFYSVKVEIDTPSAITISYMICNLFLLNLGEISFPSCVILTSVFWAEIIVAVWRKYFVTHSGSLVENTNYYIAAQNYSAKALSLNISKVCCVIMFIAWFQLYSVNTYSLTIIALGIAVWLNNSINLPNAGKRTLKEINQDFVADLKQNIEETKEALGWRNKDR